MKTKFFKKLSLVLVVAMVLSLFVPAVGAFAASSVKLNATKKYLHLGRDDANEFNFNIKSEKKTGWKYFWESSNEDVAEVNSKNGVVTATGVGTAKITVTITDKDKELVDKATATVVVRDNIEDLSISNPVEKLAVGAEHDYNRGFVTESGSKKKTSSIVRWEVSPAEGATIDDKGVFVATAAGEYTVIARAFQSKAKYADWLSDAEKYASYVLDTAETKVVVNASMVEAKQVDLDTFAVTFDTAMTKADVEKNLKLSYLAGTTKVNHQIKSVKLDDAAKVATVDVYGDLLKGTTYVVDYTDMKEVQFVSATTKVADVVRAEVLTKTVQIAVEEEIKVALYDKNGVNIGEDPDLKVRVDLKSSSDATYLNGKKLSMYKIGDTTTITATFHTYEYNEDGTEKGAITAEGIVTCVEQKTDDAGLLNAYTVVTGTPNFGDVKHSLAARDTGYTFYAQLKGTDKDGNELKISSDDPTYSANFKFTSSNENILIVNETTGALYPVKEGVANIVVSYNKTVVGSAVVTIVGARRATNIKLSAQSFTLSNDDDVFDTKAVVIEVKDQLEAGYAAVSVTAEPVNGEDVVGSLLKTGSFSGASKGSIVFEGTNVPTGTYTYKVTIEDTNNNNSKQYRYIYVTVAEPSDDDVVHHYAIETAAKEYDMKINSWDADHKEDVVVSLFGYASNGIRNRRVDLSNDGFELTITDPWNNTHKVDKSGAWSGNFAAQTDPSGQSEDGVLSLVELDASNVVKTLPTGTYRLNAKDASDKAVNADYFVVKNTQPAPALKINKLQSEKTNKLDAIKDCFDLVIDGVAYDPVNLTDCVTQDVSTTTLYVESITIYHEIISGVFIEHKVDVKQVIRYQ